MNYSVINLNNRRSVIFPRVSYGRVFAAYIEGMGWLSLDGIRPYTPQGGRQVLIDLISAGDLGRFKFVQNI